MTTPTDFPNHSFDGAKEVPSVTTSGTMTQNNMEVVASLRAAIALAESMGVIGKHSSNIYRLAGDAAEALIAAQSEIERLATALDAATECQNDMQRAFLASDARAEAAEKERDALREALAKWNESLSKGFMTSRSNGSEKQYSLQVKFQSIEDLHAAHMAMADLAKIKVGGEL